MPDPEKTLEHAQAVKAAVERDRARQTTPVEAARERRQRLAQMAAALARDEEGR